MNDLNRPEINITTIEDPVEIRIAGLNQIEMDSKNSFASSLRTILRREERHERYFETTARGDP